MKKRFIILITVLALMPAFAFADCSNQGTTVIYINGVFETENAAKVDEKALKDQFTELTKRNDVQFLLGYNQTAGGGIDDLMESMFQAYNLPVADEDLNNILIQLQGELQTQKVLLVGYSQGTYYSNALYNYLVAHGVQKQNIAVYNVASPAWYVAGGGNYLTSSTDNVISGLVTLLAKAGSAKRPLPPNITLQVPGSELNSLTGGHLFTGDYLADAPERIIGDVQKELSALPADATTSAASGSCFTAPNLTLTDSVINAGRSGLDAVAGATVQTVAVGVMVAQDTYVAASNLVNQAVQLAASVNPFGASVSGAVQTTATASAPPQTTEASQNAVNQNAATQNTQTAVASAPPQESAQDKLDDAQELLDVANAETKPVAMTVSTSPVPQAQPVTQPVVPAATVSPTVQTNAANVITGGAFIYPSLEISEVQVDGLTDAKQEFVELYNPNSFTVDLTGWYLQRKTATASSWETYAANTLFSGKIIAANGFFLIARTGYYSGTADIFTDNPVTDNNAFALKDPNGDIIDELGFGTATNFDGAPAPDPAAGQSIGRKVAADGEASTGNNAADFELQTLTPKAPNQTYVPIVSFPSDTQAPAVSFTSTAVQTVLSFPVAFTITDLAATVSPSGIASYVFQWQDVTAGGSWQQDASVAVSGSPVSQSFTRNVTGVDGDTYDFQVEATDVNGNVSDWQPEAPFSVTVELPKTILINEIQIANQTTKDEFVELYNPNNVAVNLTGFKLTKKTNSGTESDLVAASKFTGTIAADGYFLITSPGFTGTAAPDLQYSSASYSIANDSTVLLYNNNNVLLDKVGFGAAIDFEGSPTVNPPTGESIERKIIGADTDNNLNDFRISTVPTPGKSFMQAAIQNATDFKNNISSVGQAFYYPLAISWQSSSQNLDFFEVQYKLNNGSWQDWLAQTAATSGTFDAYYSLLNLGNSYSFRVRSQDTAGNQSDWSQVDVDLSVPVVINEIGLFGTTASSSDQWLELYNRSASAVNITGWDIVSGNNTIQLAGIVPADGYFLLEAGDDNTVADIPADQIFQGSLSATNTMTLYDNQNRFMDTTPGFDHYWSQSDFVKNGIAYSLERISAYSLGSDAHNWKINNGTAINGTDRKGNPIYGTPGQQNSNNQLYTSLSQDFYADTELPSSLSPYVVVANPQVAVGATLTIDAGTVVKFYNSQSTWTVNGTLNAVGTSLQPIVFASFKDDLAGGDTNGDGTATAAAEGQWAGIQFTSTSQNSDLENVAVQDSGNIFGAWPGVGLWANNSDITLKNATFQNDAAVNLYLQNSNSTVDGVQFENDTDAKAIMVAGGNPTIENSTFTNNDYGIYLSQGADASNNPVAAKPVISNNDFETNDYAIFISSADCFPVISGNKTNGNIHNAVSLPGDITQNTELSSDTPYLITDVMHVDPGVTLTIDPGVTLEFSNHSSGLEIEGTLNAVGTSAQPITFTAYNSVTPGSWTGLYFTATSQNSDLENIVVSYGGACFGACGSLIFEAAISVDQSAITLKDATLTTNDNQGIWLIDSASVIDGATLENYKTSAAGISPRAVLIQGGSPEIKNSTFQNNNKNIVTQSWFDSSTNQTIPGTPNLHDQDPADPEQNTFL